MSKSSLEAAAEAAARVNAMLIAKGKLKLPPSQIKPKIGHLATDDLDTAEVEINEAPLSARNLLTRGHTQDEICKYSGAAISTRGRYMNYEDKMNNNSGDRPLYLHIQAPKKESVDLAVSRILEMIAQYDKTAAIKIPVTSVSPVISKQIVTTIAPVVQSGMHFVQEKVFIGLENPQKFPLREKILGPNGIYLDHIKTETGANVTLRGRGSGFIEPTSGREAFEPLYIHLTHPKPEGLQAAKALAMSLVDTVHAEYAQWQQQPVLTLVPPSPPQIAYQSILGPINSVPVVVPPDNLNLPATSISHLQVTNFPVQVITSTALLAPVLNTQSENLITSNALNFPPPPLKPQYTYPVIPNSSIPTSLPTNNHPIFSTPPFTTSNIHGNQHQLPPVMMPVEVSSATLSTPMLMAPMPPPPPPNIRVFPQSPQMMVPPPPPPYLGSRDFPQMAPPFNPHSRLTTAVPNSITFPPTIPGPPRHFNAGPMRFSNTNCDKIDEENRNKRKFMEEPGDLENKSLQEQRLKFPAAQPAPNVQFRSPKLPPIRNVNKREFVNSASSSQSAKKEEVKAIENVNDGAKKLKVEQSEVTDHKGALSGLAMIYGSDDSDDEVSSNSSDGSASSSKRNP